LFARQHRRFMHAVQPFAARGGKPCLLLPTLPRMPPSAPSAIDWSQLWYPGRREPFTADEMRRAGDEQPSATLAAVVLLNLAVLCFALLYASPPAQMPRLLGGLVVVIIVGLGVARWLWRYPWRWPLAQATVVYGVAAGLAFALLRANIPDRSARLDLLLPLGLCIASVPMLWWFLIVWRAQRIEGRLAELAERERAIEMARRLASAQIEPHFLFNTLASLQHWVTTKDDRAATLLDALTGYLRATLPMFALPILPLGDEVEAVRRYLQVMQARLGARLAVTIDIDPALHKLTLPPAVLLTLAENAVQHGVEPRIDGGHVSVRGRAESSRAVIEVRDDGPGPPAAMADGVGLANVRERLTLTHGDSAQLTIATAAQGGCLATLTLPL
jgi:signal transduction histidine kinase